MTPLQRQAFLNASGISAEHLNFILRLLIGGLTIVIAVFIVAGLLKLLEDSGHNAQVRLLMYLLTISSVVMIVLSFIVS